MIRRTTMRVLLFASALAGCAAAYAQDPSSRLHLVCLGSGAANKQAQASATFWNDYGESDGANFIGNRSVPFEDQVNLWIEGVEGRVRMPRVMLPPIRGGDDGWFKLKSINIDENEISASIAVNLVNNPKLRLDRMTGAISISGKAGHYSGRCVKYDPDKDERSF